MDNITNIKNTQPIPKTKNSDSFIIITGRLCKGKSMALDPIYNTKNPNLSQTFHSRVSSKGNISTTNSDKVTTCERNVIDFI